MVHVVCDIFHKSIMFRIGSFYYPNKFSFRFLGALEPFSNDMKEVQEKVKHHLEKTNKSYNLRVDQKRIL